MSVVRGGITAAAAADDGEDVELATSLLIVKSPSLSSSDNSGIPKDSFHLAYIIYFTLGARYLLPWNAFVTAVDYFSYLYPDASVDRVFAIANMIVMLFSLLFVIAFEHKTSSILRINTGLVLSVVALVAVPLTDVWYVKGRVGIYGGFYITVCLVALCGFADSLVQASMIGCAGELPERYMQAVVAGTATSGVLVSVLRVLTKLVYAQDAEGLRASAHLYFIVGIALMIVCILSYNVAHKLPVIKYFNELKAQALNEEKKERGSDLTKQLWKSTLWEVVGKLKWYGFAITIVYVVTLCIFPGFITEDVHSPVLKDWYPILLISSYNLFDLVGKCLTSLYLVQNAKVAIGARGSLQVTLFASILCLLTRSKILQDRNPSYNNHLSFGTNKWLLYKCANDFGTKTSSVATFRNCRNHTCYVLNYWSCNWFCCFLVLDLIVHQQQPPSSSACEAHIKHCTAS